MTDIHSCSYYCDRPGCIKAQRDNLRAALAQPEQLAQLPQGWSAVQVHGGTTKVWPMTGAQVIAASLAQPEQEPAARLTCEELGYVPLSADGKSVYIDGVGLVRLAQPEQEPVAQCLETIMALADKYADAMERGPFARSYQGNIQDARANLQAAVEKIAAAPPQRKPLIWLSQEEERQIKDHCTTVACVLRAVKAKLKEKNT